MVLTTLYCPPAVNVPSALITTSTWKVSPTRLALATTTETLATTVLVSISEIIIFEPSSGSYTLDSTENTITFMSQDAGLLEGTFNVIVFNETRV